MQRAGFQKYQPAGTQEGVLPRQPK